MFKLPDLPYDYNALEPYIDEETMRIHHGKHHAAYVNNLNDALKGQDELLSMDLNDLLTNLDKVPEAVRTKVRNNGGGHANHSLFWTLMGPKKGGEPYGVVNDALKSAFGDITTFKTKFKEAALGRFGSGWVWVVNDEGVLSIVDTPNQDSPVMEGKKVILALDVWEHAYYLKYKNMRGDYIDAWWNLIDWGKVGELYMDCGKKGDCCGCETSLKSNKVSD